MPVSLEAIVLELVREAIMTKTNPTYKQLRVMVENHPEYDGKSRGTVLTSRIRSIVESEQFRQQLKEKNLIDDDNISIGFKLGRLEIKGKYKFS